MLLKDLGPIRQIAYVVNDIEKAMAHWTSVLGVGPFFYFEDAPLKDLKYRGTSTKARLSGAFSNSGSMQIELVQSLDNHPSIFNDFRAAGCQGHQHMAFWTADFDKWIARCTAAGVDVLMTGYTGSPDGRFAYIDIQTHPGMAIEISEVQGRKAQFFAEVARACVDWDGRDPVRLLNI